MQIFDYEDIVLMPRMCLVSSRSECCTDVTFGSRTFRLPVVPANMKSVINEEVAVKLASSNFFYVMHRFNIDIVGFARNMRQRNLFVSISIGVQSADFDVIDRLAAEEIEADYVTIDIAHGHAESVRQMIGHVKKRLPGAFVIAGNIGTPEAVVDLEAWGADCTKIGIGPGKVCITKMKTGFGTGGWQLSAVKWCASVATKPIIADGGIRCHGDIAKSIRFGATMVMIGSLLAGHAESPGEIVTIDGVQYKEYFGSASSENKGVRKHVEGKRILEVFRGSLDDTLREMREDLQSAISYAGGGCLADLRKCAYVSLKGENSREHLFAAHSSDPRVLIKSPHRNGQAMLAENDSTADLSSSSTQRSSAS